MLRYNDIQKVLEYLERKGFLAGSLTAALVLSVIIKEDEQGDGIPEFRG